MTATSLYVPGAANRDFTYGGGTTWEDIVHAINVRRTYQGYLVNQMIRVRDDYNGDLVIPMPDVKGEPDSLPAIPALVNLAIDSPADRAASVLPTLYTPAVNPGRPDGKGSQRYAEVRRKAWYATWHHSALTEVLLPKAFRHYRAYGSWCLVARPEWPEGRTIIETRDPLTAYPDQRFNDVTQAPENIGFMTFRSRAWILKQFGADNPGLERMMGRKMANSTMDSSDIFELVEWMDADCYVIGVIGPRYFQNVSQAYPQWPIGGLELRRWANRAGVCPVSMPHRVTLDRVQGSVTKLMPIVAMMGKLNLLEFWAAEKAVFPDMVIMGRDSAPRLVNGAWQDGRSGQVNVVEGGDVKMLSQAPGPMTQQMIDQLERAGRQSSMNPAMFGGEATGNIRSGQTVSALAGTSVDPDIQAMQRLMQRSLEVVNRAVAATDKGYFGSKTFRVFSGWPSETGQVIYTPEKHFEIDDNVVRYPMPGLDVSAQTVAVSQLVGTGLLSKHSGMVMHPLVDDADMETRLVTAERVDDAILASLLSQAQDPTMAAAQVTDLVHIAQQLQAGRTLAEAVASAHAAAQARQAQVVPPPGAGMMTDPGAQPGLSPPGAGAESPQAPPGGLPGPPAEGDASVPQQFPAVPADIDTIKNLFRALRAK